MAEEGRRGGADSLWRRTDGPLAKRPAHDAARRVGYTRRLAPDRSRAMIIADVKTWAVANPPPSRGGPCWVFVRLTTDDGVHGYGEAYGVPFSPAVVCRMIEDVAERHVVGADPFRIETMWRRIYSGAYAQSPIDNDSKSKEPRPKHKN